MATSDALTVISLEAGADLSAKQYYFVTTAADGQVDPTGDGLMADGILQNDPAAAGYAASVAISGVSKVSVGAGGVTAGDDVSSDATGQANTAATGDVILGRALETGASGSIVSMIFHPRGAL